MPGAPTSPRIRARSPTGAIPGSAAIAPRPNIRIEPTEPHGVPLTHHRWRDGPPSPALRERVLSGAERVRVGVVGLAAILLFLLAAAPPAHADDFTTLVSALGADSFSEMEQAVIALGKLGDGRAILVLTALKDGRLLKGPDGRILIARGAKTIDPLSGTELSDVAADALDRIRVNNRLRGALEGALGEVTLFSVDPAARSPPPRTPCGIHPPVQRASSRRPSPQRNSPTSARPWSKACLPLGSSRAAERSSSPLCGRSAPPPTRKSRICSTSSGRPRTPIPSCARPPRPHSLPSKTGFGWSASPPICFTASASAACCCSRRLGSPSPLASWA